MLQNQKNKRESKGAVLKEPLTPKQQEAVLKAANRIETYDGVNALHLTLFLLKTGGPPLGSLKQAEKFIKGHRRRSHSMVPPKEEWRVCNHKSKNQ